MKKKKASHYPFHLDLIEMGKGTNIHWKPTGAKARSGSIKEMGFCGVEGKSPAKAKVSE